MLRYKIDQELKKDRLRKLWKLVVEGPEPPLPPYMPMYVFDQQLKVIEEQLEREAREEPELPQLGRTAWKYEWDSDEEMGVGGGDCEGDSEVDEMISTSIPTSKEAELSEPKVDPTPIQSIPIPEPKMVTEPCSICKMCKRKLQLESQLKNKNKCQRGQGRWWRRRGRRGRGRKGKNQSLLLLPEKPQLKPLQWVEFDGVEYEVDENGGLALHMATYIIFFFCI